MTTNLSSNIYRLDRVQDFLTNISSNNYYFFVGDFLTHSNTTLQPITDNVSETYIQPFYQMIMGKKLVGDDAFPLVNNYIWTTGTVYTMYDHEDTNLLNEQFYAIEQEGSFYHIWKCLDNNNGVPSTVSPSFVYATSLPYFQAADGYRWKYMTSVGSDIVDLFQTSIYFPIQSNNTVQSLSVNGAIDIIKIDNQGALYNNYIDGSFKSNDIKINGSNFLYNISNSSVEAINGFYTGCVISLISGTGAGQYQTIIDYQSNTLGSIIALSMPFIITPDNSTTYQIRPFVKVSGVGTESVQCQARALINTFNTNSIYRIEVLQSGQDYLIANASVVANSVVPVSNTAVLTPIIPPPGGHGSNILNELYTRNVGVSIELLNSENNTIPTENQYQQIGIMKQPLFANVNLSISGATGLFQNGEEVFSFSLDQIAPDCTVTSNSSVASSLTIPLKLFSIYVTGGSGYSNSDQINIGSSTVNGAATFTTNSTGGFSNLSITITNYGVFNEGTSNSSLVFNVANSTGGSSSGSGASLSGNLVPDGVLYSSTANFNNQVKANDFIVVTSSDGSLTQLNQVSSITNSSQITLTSNCLFSCTSAIIYEATITGNGIVTIGGSANISVTEVPGNWKTGTNIIGATTGASGTISQINRNGVVKGFDTFIELYKYSVTITSGTFIPNEIVLQGNNTGYLFMADANNSLLYLNQFSNGIFSNGSIMGTSSGATANVTGLYLPEVIFGSGEMIYLENISPITRSPIQNEVFQLVFNF